MPHNLYLHSSLVQSRNSTTTWRDIQRQYAASISSIRTIKPQHGVFRPPSILAAATFYKAGMFEVSEIQDAHRFPRPLLGVMKLPIFFAGAALIAAGQSRCSPAPAYGQTGDR